MRDRSGEQAVLDWGSSCWNQATHLANPTAKWFDIDGDGQAVAVGWPTGSGTECHRSSKDQKGTGHVDHDHSNLRESPRP